MKIPADTGIHPHCAKGVATEIEEIVVNADPIKLQDLPPDGNQALFDFSSALNDAS